jgi:tetratricopeptide (TPR) repeat protein
MKTNPVLVAACFGVALGTALGAELKPLSERVTEFCAKHDTPDKVTRRLAEWTKEEPDNPDPYVFAANAYLKCADQVSINAGNAKGDFAIVDPKTNKQVGSLNTSPDQGLVKLAGSTLAIAAAKFPHRLDIHVGRMAVAQRDDDIPGVLQAARELLQAAKANPDKMKWIDGAALGMPEKDKIASELHARVLWLYRKETDEADRAACALATETLEVAPDDTRLLNDAANFHAIAGDWKKAKEFFLRAGTTNPDDLLVQLNIAKVCSKLGETDEARQRWQQVIKKAPGTEQAKAAQEELDQLPRAKQKSK